MDSIKIYDSHRAHEREISLASLYSEVNPKIDFNLAFNIVNSSFEILSRVLVDSIIKGNNLDNLSFVDNFFVRICLGLKDSDIKILVDRFIERLRKEGVSRFQLDDQVLRVLVTGNNVNGDGKFFSTLGVLAMVNFIRSRKKLYEARSERVSFYIDDYLDSMWGIDLIEVFEVDDGFGVNIVQFKNSKFDEREISLYHSKHRSWVNSKMIDLATYQSPIISRPEDLEVIKSFMEDLKKIDEAFVNFLTGGDYSKDKLLDDLHIGRGRNKTQRFWIIKRYLSVLVSEMSKLKEERLFDDSDYAVISKVLSELETELNMVLEKTRDFRGISEINSICATSGNIEGLSSARVFTGYGDKRKVVRVAS